ncbi:unnamed protein product [Caenorhabditis bovis]|uniref:C2H2-type domain-containing protein n=1 Tax=Caenorhabditis bovis TaxID=2654633 RepID=A0A8S1EGM5_9PELO|nr:unnamed protein product [Caenorhabditis bovis]
MQDHLFVDDPNLIQFDNCEPSTSDASTHMEPIEQIEEYEELEEIQIIPEDEIGEVVEEIVLGEDGQPTVLPPTHITPFNPDEGEPQDSPIMPLCHPCNTLFQTFAGFEYHVLKDHVGYRQFSCAVCHKRSFYTEAEGRHHMDQFHTAFKHLALCKHFDPEKEEATMELYNQVHIMRREDIDINAYEAQCIYGPAVNHYKKFNRMRFTIPQCVKKRNATTLRSDKTTQVGVSAFSRKRMYLPFATAQQRQIPQMNLNHSKLNEPSTSSRAPIFHEDLVRPKKNPRLKNAMFRDYQSSSRMSRGYPVNRIQREEDVPGPSNRSTPMRFISNRRPNTQN